MSIAADYFNHQTQQWCKQEPFSPEVERVDSSGVTHYLKPLVVSDRFYAQLTRRRPAGLGIVSESMSQRVYR
jgi:hypothetical protein